MKVGSGAMRPVNGAIVAAGALLVFVLLVVTGVLPRADHSAMVRGTHDSALAAPAQFQVDDSSMAKGADNNTATRQPRKQRRVLLSSISSSLGWKLDSCDDAIGRVGGLSGPVLDKYPDIEYVLILENCPSRSVAPRFSVIQTLLPDLPGAAAGGDKAVWSSKGKFLGYRFLEFYEWLLQNPDVTDAVMADGFDVVMVANPFDAMAAAPAYDLFIQSEWRRHDQSSYMMDRVAACLDADMAPRWADKYIMNCGLWGGRREAVLWVLERMRHHYYRIVTGDMGNEACFGLGPDMSVFNEVLYHEMPAAAAARVKRNEPLTPVYRNCHLSYRVHAPATAPVDASMSTCSEPLPLVVDPRWSLTSTDDWVRDVCTGGPTPEVHCHTLPFALIHKGTVSFV